MEGKARENLEAAKILQVQGFFDSSASRAYYAAYLAAWRCLSNLGIRPEDNYWHHDTFPEVLSDEYKLIGPFQREQFELLYSRRIKADYYVDRVEKEEANDSIQSASGFISLLIDEVGPVE